MSLVGMFALEKDVATETTADIKGLEKGWAEAHRERSTEVYYT